MRFLSWFLGRSFASAIKYARKGYWIRSVYPVKGCWMQIKTHREFEDEYGCSVALTVHGFDYRWQVRKDDGDGRTYQDRQAALGRRASK